MKNKLLLITLLAVLLSSLFIMGCEEDDKDPVDVVPENVNDINPNYVDYWDLFEVVEDSTRGELVQLEENYLMVTTTSIIIGGAAIAGAESNSIFMDDNQIGYMDADEAPV